MSKISIIIPVYNTEKFVSRCLDTVLRQTYKNLEIICINDCSPDNSVKIINEYTKKDDRIKRKIKKMVFANIKYSNKIGIKNGIN